MGRAALRILLGGQLLLVPVSPAQPPSDGKGFGASMGALVERMMNDPAMKEMARVEQGAELSRIYGPLYRQLELSEEEKGKLSDLLLARNARPRAGGSAVPPRAGAARTASGT